MGMTRRRFEIPRPRRGVEIQMACVVLFLIGWFHNGFSLFDIGQRSITLLMLAGIPLLFFIQHWRPRLVGPHLASTLLAFMVALPRFEAGRPVSHALQNVFGIATAVAVSNLEWPLLIEKTRKWVLVLAVPVCAYGVFQLYARSEMMPSGWLPVTNIQQYEATGFQRNFMSPDHWRASSVFVEPSDFGYFALWVFIFGITSPTLWYKASALVIAFISIFATQSLGAAIGLLCVGVVHMMRGRQFLGMATSGIVACGALYGFLYLFPLQTARYLGRLDAASKLDRSADSNRVARIPSNFSVVTDSPFFGHGIGTNNIVEQNGLSSGVFQLLIERGVLGAALYLAPYLWVFWVLLFRTSIGGDFRAVQCCFAALNVYTFAVFGMVYFQPFWFSLGLTLWGTDRALQRPSLDSRKARKVLSSPRESDWRPVLQGGPQEDQCGLGHAIR